MAQQNCTLSSVANSGRLTGSPAYSKRIGFLSIDQYCQKKIGSDNIRNRIFAQSSKRRYAEGDLGASKFSGMNAIGKKGKK
jgi:hypothetical protein